MKLINCDVVANVKLFGNFTTTMSFEDTTFHGKARFHDCAFNQVSFNNTTFKELADFWKTTFDNCEDSFYRTKFEKVSVFSDVVFKDDVRFEFTNFQGNSIFRKANFEKLFDFSEANIWDGINFFNMEVPLFKELTFTENITPIRFRETCKIIKHQLETTGDVIGSNKYYEYEMKADSKELKPDYKKIENICDGICNFFKFLNIFSKKRQESLVNFIHWLFSNHSQSWVRALLAWLVVGLFGTVWVFEHDYSDFCGLEWSACWVSFLNNFSSIAFIIASSEETKNIEYKFLLYFLKVIEIYIIYQFTTAVRQNTRRG